MIVNVKITQTLIDIGNRGSPELCPVTRGMKEAGLEYPWVNTEYINFFYKGEDHQEPTPRLVALFIAAFDNGEPVEPFEFELEVNE